MQTICVVAFEEEENIFAPKEPIACVQTFKLNSSNVASQAICFKDGTIVHNEERRRISKEFANKKWTKEHKDLIKFI